MSLLDLLAQVIQVFTDLLPRLSRRPLTTEWAVVDVMGLDPFITKYPVPFAPVIGMVEFYPSTEIATNPCILSVMTADNRSLTIAPGFAYKIVDPILCRASWGEEYDARIAMLCRGMVSEWFSGHNLNHLQDIDDDQVAEDIEDELVQYGVELSWFRIEECVPARCVRHYGIELEPPVE